MNQSIENYSFMPTNRVGTVNARGSRRSKNERQEKMLALLLNDTREERSNKRSSYLQIPARSSPRFTPVRSVQGRVQQRGLRRAKARISQGKERLIGNDGLSLKK